MKPGDRVSFTRVNDEELIALRERVNGGSYEYQIAEGELNVGEYLARLEEIKPETEAFRRRQQEAAERTPVP
jgi:urea carboxylase